MANKTPVNYPHVNAIQDVPTQASLRLVWDQLRNQNISTADMQALLTTLQATLTSTATIANQALSIATAATLSAASAAQTAASNTPPVPPPSNGPNIPGPEPPLPPPIPPPQPPSQSTMSTTDDINLATVTVLNSPPDIATWSHTATMTLFDFSVNGAAPDFNKRLAGAGQWDPNYIPPGFTGPIQYTLWIFLKISGTWYGSGCIEYWYQPMALRNGGPPSQVAANWYYDAARWAPMTGHQPAVGEGVGFMLSSGDARNNRGQSIKERTQVVVIPFPTDAGCIFTT